jgi:hypothetical protein
LMIGKASFIPFAPWSVRRGSDGWRRWWARRKSGAEARRRQERQTARQRRTSLARRRTKISQARISFGRAAVAAAMRRRRARVVTPDAGSASVVALRSSSTVGFWVRSDTTRIGRRPRSVAGFGSCVAAKQVVRQEVVDAKITDRRSGRNDPRLSFLGD